jgi:hypothetical protein
LFTAPYLNSVFDHGAKGFAPSRGPEYRGFRRKWRAAIPCRR